MLINDSPLGLTVQGSCLEPIFLPDFCDPCYFETKFLPRIISVSKKDSTVLKALFKSALASVQTLSSRLCGFCVTAQTDDCDCFMLYYALIGAPTSIVIDTTDDTCITPIAKVAIDQCGQSTEYSYYCKSLCSTCATVYLSCTSNFDLMKKIASIYPRWQRLKSSRKNIEACLTEWFGRRCTIVSDSRGGILWTSGQQLTPDEKKYLPFIYSLLPVYKGITLTNVWRA
mgnify:CR=1 FL=1